VRRALRRHPEAAFAAEGSLGSGVTASKDPAASLRMTAWRGFSTDFVHNAVDKKRLNSGRSKNKKSADEDARARA